MYGLPILMALAATANMPRKKPRLRRYARSCGPPYPETRQQRRAMMREREKVLSAIAKSRRKEAMT